MICLLLLLSKKIGSIDDRINQRIRLDGIIDMNNQMNMEIGSSGQDSVYVGHNIMALMDGVDSKLYSQKLVDIMKQKYES